MTSSTVTGLWSSIDRHLRSWSQPTTGPVSNAGRLAPRLMLGAALTFCLGGCGSSGGTANPGSGALPSPAHPDLRVLAPASGATITGSVIRIQLLIRGVRLVNKMGQPNNRGEAHLRVWVDTEDPTAPSLVQTDAAFDLTGLAPGLHRVMVELRENDGTPMPGPPASTGSDTPMRKEFQFSTVSALARIQKEIFSPTCATEGCHVPGGAGPMPLTDTQTSYESLVNLPAENSTAQAAGKKRVVPGRPEQSFILQKLTRQLQYGEGDAMPQNAPPLTGEQIELIRLWISQGAVPAP